MELDSIMLSALTQTTGDKHYTLPRTTGGEAPSRPEQQVATPRAAPDNGYAHSAPTRTARRA